MINGDTYIGRFELDQMSGPGELIFSDGTKLKGTWVNGKK